MRSRDPRVKRWDPPAIMIASLFGGEVPPNSSVVFTVPIPDSRLRVKLSLLFIVGDYLGIPLDWQDDTGQLLWLAEREEDRSGRKGSMVPISNLFGTSAAPGQITSTTDMGVYGYSREFVTAADEIYGRMDISIVPSGGGRWFLQTRYQPDIEMTWEEWNVIWPQCNPAVRTPIDVPGAGS